ncbi:hypothetical protein LRS05_05085 [Flavobacterium sp. J372]|uniref:hypothetical protein n=1 Tax=Flavobacterium sp. J372 TaxID=2898436 RepID=UPI0021519448|nr:hypothetical protein [Flavobacterium sp. J372]MCR5861552.1 hypothetical protein [Flavobacterium sp. J372]
MKYFLIIIIAITSCAGMQQSTPSDKTTLLRLELLRNKDKFSAMNIGDSILIHKEVLPVSALKRYYIGAVSDNHLSMEEAREIFGNENEPIYNHIPFEASNWTYGSFPGLKVALFDEEKYTQGYNFNKEGKIGIGTLEIRHISKPLILPNRKYAIIAWGSEHYGSMVSIYKKK